jgi:anti-anti-sigma regulatory factor
VPVAQLGTRKKLGAIEMAKKEPSLAEPVLVANGKKESRITLGPVLDIRAAVPLRDGLQKALKRGKPLILDAAQVDRLSTPCIQVLLAAGKSAEGADNPMVLAHASDAFVAAFTDLGLFADLMSWQDAA